MFLDALIWACMRVLTSTSLSCLSFPRFLRSLCPSVCHPCFLSCLSGLIFFLLLLVSVFMLFLPSAPLPSLSSFSRPLLIHLLPSLISLFGPLPICLFSGPSSHSSFRWLGVDALRHRSVFLSLLFCSCVSVLPSLRSAFSPAPLFAGLGVHSIPHIGIGLPHILFHLSIFRPSFPLSSGSFFFPFL